MAKKQSFVKGALILIIASLLVKVIGAIFKVPLANLIESDGMGLFNSAYSIYTWMFIIGTAGFPIAISKMISEASTKGDNAGVKQIFRVAMMLLSSIGIVGFCVMFFGAGTFASLISNQRATLGIMALSPAFLFVSLMSVYRGYFQGMQNMYPTAFSEVIEALGKLILGYLFAVIGIKVGIEYGAAGAVFGVSIGAFLGFLLLAVFHIFINRDVRHIKTIKPHRSSLNVLKELLVIAIPITLGASVFSLTNLIDLAMIMNNLQSIGYSEIAANSLYGLYTGFAVPIFNMPPTLVTAISISIVPTIASYIVVKNKYAALQNIHSALRLCIFIALPCAAGISVLAKPILMTINTSKQAPEAAGLLQILALAILSVSLVSLTNAILQAAGKQWIPIITMCTGGVAKVIINYNLVRTPSININGAPIGTNVCYLIIVTLNLLFLYKILDVRYNLVDFVIKPLIAVSTMVLTLIFLYNFLSPILNVRIATLLTITVGGGIYLITLLLIKALKREDYLLMPMGDKIVRILGNFKLVN